MTSWLGNYNEKTSLFYRDPCKLFSDPFIHMSMEGVEEMVTIEPIDIDGHTFIATTVLLPKTTLLTVSNDVGYIMCGALDVALLNEALADRGIISGRAVGVRTIEQLLNAPLESVTISAEKRGIHKGMIGREALLKML